MIDIIQYPFFQRAILILILSSIVAGVIGTLIVVKKLSMIGGSIAHGAFGGLGIAYFLGISPVIGALSFSVIGATLIGLTRRGYRNYLDSILSMFWAGGMSLGLLFLFMTPGYASDLFSYLFGNVLLSSTEETVLLLGTTAFIIATYLIFKETLTVTLFNEDFAKFKGLMVTGIFTVFLVMTAIVVVMLIRTVGIVLTLSILTIAPAIAVRYAKSLERVMLIAVSLNVFTSILGLFWSYILDIPTAPTIIILQVIVFVISFIERSVR